VSSLGTIAHEPAVDLRKIEMDQAREIQASLLPGGPMRGPSFEIACRFSPFSEVSGDFADYFDLPDGLIGLYVGDVVGKGLAAAMYGAMVMGTLRGTTKTGADTGSVLATLNKRLLVRPVSGRYCSTIYALFNPVTLEMRFSNAGLPLPLHASSAGCATVGDGGLPSGLFPGSSYEVHSVQMRPGDAILLATDGLHELRNGRDEDFSWGKLAEVWQRCRGSSAEETLDLLFAGTKEFVAGRAQHDDITVIVVKALSTMVLPRPGGGFSRVALR
jgi:phosphoserine phosphatase RsbU/P